MRILLVEDDCHLTDIYSTKLRAAGHEVECAPTGKDALILLYHWKYDVVLLDLMMPGGNGVAVLQQMQENGDATPVFIHTNLDLNTKKREAKQYPNVVDFLVKIDYSPAEVVQMLEDWYGGDRQKDEVSGEVIEGGKKPHDRDRATRPDNRQGAGKDSNATTRTGRGLGSSGAEDTGTVSPNNQAKE